MSESLKEFLSAWIQWVDAGAPNRNPFERNLGLCVNFEYYLEEIGVTEGDADGEVYGLTDVFGADRLNRAYPFGGGELFYEESGADAMHLNEQRIAWVRSKVAQFEVV